MTAFTLFDFSAYGCAAVLAIAVLHHARRRRAPFPPGPTGWPIIGNALDFDPLCAWKTFTEWKGVYGDLVGLNVFGTKVLILNSQKAINDLLDKRGNIYSDRPVFVAAGELMGLNKSMALMPYGSEWRACRRLEHIALGPTSVRQYEPIQEKFAAMLVNELLENPNDFYDLIRLSAARVVLSVTYGLSARVADREYIDHADETMSIISKSTVPGAFLCDLIPSMRYFPKWFEFQRKCDHGRQMIELMVSTPYERVKEAIDQGKAEPSLTSELLQSMSKDELTPEMQSRIKWTAGSMYGAGGESTFGTTLVFLIAMALHPDIQTRGQKELDSVVGRHRLPAIADRGSLPYVEALTKEVMRWHPMLPLSIARRVTRDDVYEGWMIPKDTIVIPNSWQNAFEPNPKYPPHEFIPDRFLDETCLTMDPAAWAFGYGRRICPGKLLGESNVFLFVATLLAAFEIFPPADGVLVPQFEEQLVSVPKRFKCSLILRDGFERDIVRNAAAASL